MSNRRKRPQPSMRAASVQRAEAQAAGRRRRRIVVAAIGGAAAIAAVVGVGFLLTSGSGSEAAEPDPLAVELGCSSCHSVDGSRSEGPTWDGLWGSEVTLADGTTVTADEDYIRRSITDPSSQVVQGYATMPDVQVTDAQVEQLVAIIRGDA